MIAALVAGLLAGYGIAMPVGAVATYLLALTARTSLKIGAGAALGVATADGLYALVAAFGGTELAHAIQPIMLPLRWASVIVLIALAAKGAAAGISHHSNNGNNGSDGSSSSTTEARSDKTPLSPARAYFGLLGLTMLNPMTVVYFAALVLGSQAQDDAAAPGSLKDAVFVFGAFAASASWQLLLAGGGALLGKALTGHRGRLATALASSAVVLFLALRLLAAAI